MKKLLLLFALFVSCSSTESMISCDSEESMEFYGYVLEYTNIELDLSDSNETIGDLKLRFFKWVANKEIDANFETRNEELKTIIARRAENKKPGLINKIVFKINDKVLNNDKRVQDYDFDEECTVTGMENLDLNEILTKIARELHNK